MRSEPHLVKVTPEMLADALPTLAEILAAAQQARANRTPQPRLPLLGWRAKDAIAGTGRELRATIRRRRRDQAIRQELSR